MSEDTTTALEWKAPLGLRDTYTHPMVKQGIVMLLQVNRA